MSRPTARGFTLIELLVVIAIIALVIGILLPSLSGARERGKSLKCQTNIRELVRGSLCYVIEWGLLPPCLDNYSASNLSGDKPGLDWLGIGNQTGGFTPGSPDDPWTGNPKGFMAAPKFGLIYKYYRNENMIMCPSDTEGPYLAQRLDPPGNGKFSYTMMSAGVSLRSPDKIPADDTRVSGNSRPSSFAPMFLEEHPDGPNNGNREGNFGAWRGIGQPLPPDDGDHLVARHGPKEPRPGIMPGSSTITNFAQGRSNIGFADGHVEEMKPNFGFGRTQLTTIGGYDGLPNYIAGILGRYGVKGEVSAFVR